MGSRAGVLNAIDIATLGTSAVITVPIRADDSRKAALRRGDEAINESRAKQDAFLNEERQRVSNAESTEQALLTRNDARRRQKSQMGSAQGRSSTILTSPLGVTGDATQPGKTLLGV